MGASEAKSFRKPPTGTATPRKQNSKKDYTSRNSEQLLLNNVVKEKQYLVSLSMDLT
jgi:hypothetical protein